MLNNMFGFGVKSEGRKPENKIKVTYLSNDCSTGKNIKWNDFKEGNSFDAYIEGTVNDEKIKGVYKFTVVNKWYDDSLIGLALENEKFGIIFVSDAKKELKRNKEKEFTHKGFNNKLIDSFTKEQDKLVSTKKELRNVRAEKDLAVTSFKNERDARKRDEERHQNEVMILNKNHDVALKQKDGEIAVLQERLINASLTKGTAHKMSIDLMGDEFFNTLKGLSEDTRKIVFESYVIENYIEK